MIKMSFKANILSLIYKGNLYSIFKVVFFVWFGWGFCFLFFCFLLVASKLIFR